MSKQEKPDHWWDNHFWSGNMGVWCIQKIILSTQYFRLNMVNLGNAQLHQEEKEAGSDVHQDFYHPELDKSGG